MNNIFITEIEQEKISILDKNTKNVIAFLKKKEWDSDFFKKKIGVIYTEDQIIKRYDLEVINSIFNILIDFAKKKKYIIVEYNLNTFGSSSLLIAPYLEDKGFRLIDTRITFKTLIDRKKCEKLKPIFGKIRFVKLTDLKDILNLTHQSLTDNKLFFSRFKNRDYFTYEDSKRYFEAWITNMIKDDDSIFVVWEYNNKVIGYFIYKDYGKLNDVTIYKGILTAIDPEYRGHNGHLVMQSYAYDHFPEDFIYLDNTTQLTNFPVIKIHIKSRKELSSISFTFFWSNRFQTE